MSCAMVLMLAYRPAEENLFYNAAAEQLNYILGKNPLGMCYVTGHGSCSPSEPHHRPSTAAGEAVKGMVVGGADQELEDPVVRDKCKASFPAVCYADDHCSYSTNEVDTYWNSILTLLLVWILNK